MGVHARPWSETGKAALESQLSDGHSAFTCTVQGLVVMAPREIDIRLLGKGNSTSHGARPVHHIISMLKRIESSFYRGTSLMRNTHPPRITVGS